MAKNIVFGIDTMAIFPITAGTEGTAVLVKGRSFSFGNESDSETFEGNNAVIDTRYYNKRVTGSGEVAEWTPAVLALLGDGIVTTTGTAPNQSFAYDEPNTTSDKKVSIATRSYAGDGTVVQAKVNAVRITGPSFDLGTGAYSGVTFDFEGTGNAAGMLWGVTSFEGSTAVLTFA